MWGRKNQWKECLILHDGGDQSRYWRDSYGEDNRISVELNIRA
jgi:hypothetical protein